MTNELYAQHLRDRQRLAESALSASGFDALVIHSGAVHTYFADDQDAPFHTTPHFAHWVPLAGPNHLLVVRPGKKPFLVRVKPDDYWYEQAPLGQPFWLEHFEFTEVPDEASAWKLALLKGKIAFIGDPSASTLKHGVTANALNPQMLTSRLDWDRSFKTAYEVACLEEATKKAARGHAAARNAFVEGASELEIHQTYMSAVGCVDEELPYGSIVALDEKGATLHYTGKRTKRDGRVLLIDSGAKHLGYGSDITRTWTAKNCDPQFVELVRGMDKLQQELCARVKPGLSYGELHHQAHLMIADLLHTSGILKLGGEAAVKLGLTLPFFPHGLGHFLGIQVHDIAGRQMSPEGGNVPPPAQYPHLRTTRKIEEHQVFTIEPGLYFIDLLLRGHRDGPHAQHFDWEAIDRLKACGGIRIEDNVVVTKTGHRNLTRPHVP